MTEIITVKQLPVIEEQLKNIKIRFEEEVKNALSLECTEDSYKTVKTLRADLTKIFKSLEEKRISAKKAILKPYEDFEAIYKTCVNDVYEPAKQQLDKKIADVENGLKKQKEDEIKEYFDEYAKAKNIDFIKFSDINLNITLNASKKSLKEKTAEFIDKISDDLKMIETQEYKAEILVEYKKSLNVSQAILTVTNRHKAIEEEQKKTEIKEEKLNRIFQAEQKVDEVLKQEELTAPTEIKETQPIQNNEQIYEMTFTVKGTLEKLKKLKNYLKEEGLINE